MSAWTGDPGYTVWDTEYGNVVGYFRTEAEAWACVEEFEAADPGVEYVVVLEQGETLTRVERS